MSKKLTKKDIMVFIMLLFAPFIGFQIVVMDTGVLNQMIEATWTKVIGGFLVSVYTLLIWFLVAALDKYLTKTAVREHPVELDDPTLAFGQYLFDKKGN